MKLEDNDFFPFGVHAKNGLRMRDVPADYFDWFMAQSWRNKWPEILDYIQRSKGALDKEMEAKGFDKAPLPTHKPNKLIQERLQAISEICHKAKLQYIRTQEKYLSVDCPICGEEVRTVIDKGLIFGKCHTEQCIKWEGRKI